MTLRSALPVGGIFAVLISGFVAQAQIASAHEPAPIIITNTKRVAQGRSFPLGRALPMGSASSATRPWRSSPSDCATIHKSSRKLAVCSSRRRCG